ISLQQKKSRFDKFPKKETHKTALIFYFDFKVLSFTRMIIGKIIGLRCVFWYRYCDNSSMMSCFTLYHSTFSSDASKFSIDSRNFFSAPLMSPNDSLM